MTSFAGITDRGVTIVRRYDDGRPTTVDHPAAGTYRQPYDGDLAGLEPVDALPPDLSGHCGWYGDEAVLLTQIPEADLGEPMMLLGRGEDVVRLHPTSRGLLGEDGTRVTLGPDTLRVSGPAPTGAPGAGAVTPGGDATPPGPLSPAGEVTLTRSGRYRERDATFMLDSTPLGATLITPAGPGPFPAAVFLHGAGGGQRDFCRLFAQPVLDAGVAVLLYDKPGHGVSGGGDPTIYDQARAAHAAIDRLRALSDVDRVGLVAFSNGGWSAPMVAARRDDVAFVVGVGVPGISMADAEVHRRTTLLREAGMGGASVAAVARAWHAIFTIAGTGAATPELTTALGTALAEVTAAADLRGYEVPDHVRHNPMLSPIPPDLPLTDLVAMLTGPGDPQLLHDPAADYARTHCPVTLHYGARDTSVPAATSVDAVRRVRPDVEVHLHPDLEHMLNVVPTGLAGLTAETAMYGFHQFRFGPLARATIAAGLRRVLGPQGTVTVPGPGRG